MFDVRKTLRRRRRRRNAGKERINRERV